MAHGTIVSVATALSLANITARAVTNNVIPIWVGGPTGDVALWSGGGTLNLGADTIVLSGSSTRGLLRFDLSSIPATATCISATLQLTQVGTSGYTDPFTVTVRQISAANAAWIEGISNGLAQAGEPCWNALAADGAGGVTTDWAGSAGLSTSGTDYETTALGTFGGYLNDANGTNYTAALLVSRVQGWFGSPNTNYGILLTSITYGVGQLASREHATAAYRPKLTVVYSYKRTP